MRREFWRPARPRRLPGRLPVASGSSESAPRGRDQAVTARPRTLTAQGIVGRTVTASPVLEARFPLGLGGNGRQIPVVGVTTREEPRPSNIASAACGRPAGRAPHRRVSAWGPVRPVVHEGRSGERGIGASRAASRRSAWPAVAGLPGARAAGSARRRRGGPLRSVGRASARSATVSAELVAYACPACGPVLEAPRAARVACACGAEALPEGATDLAVHRRRYRDRLRKRQAPNAEFRAAKPQVKASRSPNGAGLSTGLAPGTGEAFCDGCGAVLEGRRDARFCSGVCRQRAARCTPWGGPDHPRGDVMARIKWPPVLEHAAEIVGAHNTKMTIRQVFYRLVTEDAHPQPEERLQPTVPSLRTVATGGPLPPRLLDQAGASIAPRRSTGPVTPSDG